MYLTENARKMESPGNKETIHSGHFMVSHFEAEDQDDDDTAVPIPDIAIKDLQKSSTATNVIMDHFVNNNKRLQPIAIENGLSTLFQCMSIAYRQKLTSPKWNRFRGIRLRWKDKIRLNNVIWRCWHMQFIRKQNTLICQFASPLDVDTHNKPEAIVLEGKYWKRKLEAVTAEYKKWRMFYKTQSFGHHKEPSDLFLEMELLRYDFPCPENVLMDEDYMGLMSDTLFSTISNQPFAFPDTREIAKAGLSHFIQPSLGPLQPNLPNNDIMDFEDILSGKLPTVPEEPVCNKSLSWSYPELDLATTSNNLNLNPSSNTIESFQPQSTAILDVQQLQTNRPQQQQTYANDILLQQPSYSVISKSSTKAKEKGGTQQTAIYPDYQLAEMSTPVTLTVLQLPQQSQQGFRGYKESYKKPNPVPGQSKIPQLVKEEKGNGMRTIQRVRRSRSNTREPLKRVAPPLQSAVSDPSLISPANNIILSQLLTNSSESLYRNAQATSSTSTESTIRCKEEQSVPSSVKLCVTSPVIISPVNMTAVQKSEMPQALSPPSSIIQENPSSLSSPTSPHGSLESLNREPIHREQRRAGHIHAEQKRRYNIKNGFDMMYSLIPPLNQNPNAKLSKAAMLQKGAEYIVQLRNEREQLKDEMDSLRQQIDSLTTSISNCQCLLPATGAPISSKKRDLKMQEMFDEYVRIRTNENWKFWIFSLLFKPLLGSFNNFVSTASLEDLYKTTFHWVEQHCALGDLRPIVFNSLKYLCTKTEILLMPDKLPEEARSQVIGPSTTNHTNL